MTDTPSPSPLDQLYQMLGDAHGLEGNLEQQRQVLREQVTSREQGLQQARTVAEAAGDTRQVQQIDAELDELRRAWSTLTDDDDTDTGELPENEHQAADSGSDQRGGHGDPGGAGT